MPGRVTDASVLGAVAFREPRSTEAEALIKGVELLAPSIIFYELTSIAHKKARHYPAQRKQFTDILLRALSLGIEIRDVNHPQVLQLALETGLTTYDASYIYVAQTVGVPLVTFDKKMQAAYDKIGGSN